MLENEVIQAVENVEGVEMPVEVNSTSGKNFVKGALIVGGIVGTVVLIKKVVAPKVKAWKAKRAAAKAAQAAEAEIEEEAK